MDPDKTSTMSTTTKTNNGTSNGVNTKNDTFVASKIQATSWPKSCPVKSESKYISISIGNTSLHWAIHGFSSKHKGVNHNLDGGTNTVEPSHPNFFWRTPHLAPEEIISGDDIDIDNDGNTSTSTRSPSKSKSESNTDLLNALCRHLPTQVSDYIFGPSKSQSIASAHAQTKVRGHSPTFYILSTNSVQTNLLEQMIGSIPCRIYLCQRDDFFGDSSANQNNSSNTKSGSGSGSYPTIGVDRLANLRGAQAIQGFPALVLDGGSAMTYTASDTHGKILGGGIVPGLEMRMRSLKAYTDALPLVNIVKEVGDLQNRRGRFQMSPQEVEAVRGGQDKEGLAERVSIFQRDTEGAMVVGVLHEVGCGLRGVVHAWNAEVDKQEQKQDSKHTKTKGTKRKANDSAGTKKHVVASTKKEPLTNDNRTVIVTGGSGPTIVKLLEQDNGKLFDSGVDTFDQNENEEENENEISTKHVVGLQHFGIAAMVYEKSQERYSIPNNGSQKKSKSSSATTDQALLAEFETYIGKKVAKEFQVPDADGENIYRGQVLEHNIYEGTMPMFRVVYQDGDEEDVSLDDLGGE